MFCSANALKRISIDIHYTGRIAINSIHTDVIFAIESIYLMQRIGFVCICIPIRFGRFSTPQKCWISPSNSIFLFSTYLVHSNVINWDEIDASNAIYQIKLRLSKFSCHYWSKFGRFEFCSLGFHSLPLFFFKFNQILLFWPVKIIKKICARFFIYSPSNFVPNGIRFWYFLL